MSIRRETDSIIEKIEGLIYSYNEKRNIAEAYDKLSEITRIDVNDMPQELKERVNDALSATDEEILDTILGRTISQEFGAQLGHVHYKDIPSTVEVDIKDQRIKFSQTKGKKPHIDSKIELVKEVLYVDDPYILDSLGDAFYGRGFSHRRNLILKLTGEEKNEFSAIDDVVINRNLEEVLDKLSTVCSGELQNSEDGITYADDKLKEGILLTNLSTGLKSFVILKTLLQKGYLERNGMVVLDEPETHLHPEWMRTYAELVVLLQKVLDINIVISTHSADFLSFIELFTRKYDVAEKCKYYLLSVDSADRNLSIIQDVSDNLDRIYSKLSKPFLQASEEFDILNESK